MCWHLPQPGSATSSCPPSLPQSRGPADHPLPPLLQPRCSSAFPRPGTKPSCCCPKPPAAKGLSSRAHFQMTSDTRGSGAPFQQRFPTSNGNRGEQGRRGLTGAALASRALGCIAGGQGCVGGNGEGWPDSGFSPLHLALQLSRTRPPHQPAASPRWFPGAQRQPLGFPKLSCSQHGNGDGPAPGNTPHAPPRPPIYPSC